MPKAKELSELNRTQQRAYRAIWKLYKENGASPSQVEIAHEAGLKTSNLHPVLFWLLMNGWITKKENQHRSIVPMVRLSKKQTSVEVP